MPFSSCSVRIYLEHRCHLGTNPVFSSENHLVKTKDVMRPRFARPFDLRVVAHTMRQSLQRVIGISPEHLCWCRRSYRLGLSLLSLKKGALPSFPDIRRLPMTTLQDEPSQH